MCRFVDEEEFLARQNEPIQYIGIYELIWLLDDNLLDSEGIIVAFQDKKYLISSKLISQENQEEEFSFTYREFTESYEGRSILSSPEEPISFIQKESDGYPVLLFRLGKRFVAVTANNDGYIAVGMTHWNENGDWVDYENDIMLNDK